MAAARPFDGFLFERRRPIEAILPPRNWLWADSEPLTQVNAGRAVEGEHARSILENRGWTMLYNWLEYAALCVFVSVVAVVVIVVASEMARGRREREIYRQTRRRK